MTFSTSPIYIPAIRHPCETIWLSRGRARALLTAASRFARKAVRLALLPLYRATRRKINTAPPPISRAARFEINRNAATLGAQTRSPDCRQPAQQKIRTARMDSCAVSLALAAYVSDYLPRAIS